MKKTNWPLEHRFPTKKARDKADAAMDVLSSTATLAEAIDTWIRVYHESGGVENRPS